MKISIKTAANNSPIFAGVFYRRSRASLAAKLFRQLLLLLSFFAFAILPFTANANNHLVFQNPIKPLVIDPNQLKLKKLLFCLPPFVPNAGATKCVCPAGNVKLGNNCVNLGNVLPKPLPLACFLPFTLNAAGTKCVCPAGKVKVGNTCKLKFVPLPLFCNAPFVPNGLGNKCVCPAGTKFKFGSCVPNVLILCTPPFIPNAAQNQCLCPPGQFKFQNTCVVKVPLPQPPVGPACKWPFVYSSNLDACVCSSGYRLNNSQTSCIRNTISTPSVPRATIRQIQSCLAILGYEPGPADGVSGRRTRQSWSEFRLDEGLQNRSSRLSDPVIQDRLFQKCEQAQNPAPVIDEPVDPGTSGQGDPGNVGQGNGIITNFDPQTGYPPLQCATPGLLQKLKDALGDDLDIGLCGQSCTPIPPGMSPAQIAATGNNVNWCLSCSKIGNELLCSANPPEQN